VTVGDPDEALEPPDRLEERASAAYAAGDFEGCVAAWEALYADRLRAADAPGAARAAAMVAMYLLVDSGLMAPVRGWLARAERLLEPEDEAPLHAVLAAVRGYERLFCGDPEAARGNATRAVELGARHGVAEAAVIGQTALARLTLADGRIAEGLALLDEVGARLMAGEVDALTTGMMLCEVVCAAQSLAMHDLAREWTDAMERWGQHAGFGGLHGRCRVHRAELLRISGPCEAAEEEALGACADLRPWMRREFGWPLTELGMIRLRRGDLAGAEAAFTAAHEHSWSPQPGLALLHLARGEADRAASSIADAIDHPVDLPWKERPVGNLQIAPLLDAQTEIALARSDADTCTEAATRLTGITDTWPSRSLAAAAALARARAALLAGDADAAATEAATSVAAWADLGAPYETSVARVVLGRARAAAGRDDLAHEEWTTARRTFADFGAVTRAEEVSRLLGEPSRGALPAGAASFRASDGLRTVCFHGSEVVLPDLVGFRHLERLLMQPDVEVHVLDLVGTPLAEAGVPLLDEDAKAAYRRRLADVEEDLEEARRNDDLARLELAERDREYLLRELERAVGRHGRVRTTGGTAERARTSVARSVRYALDRLAEAHPLAAGHLRQCVRTGTWCRYVPDPVSPISWET
jgi:hypothetical protein